MGRVWKPGDALRDARGIYVDRAFNEAVAPLGNRHRQLLHLESAVDADGMTATFAARLAGEQHFYWRASVAQIGMLENELRTTRYLMIDRLGERPPPSRELLEVFTAHAVTPERIKIAIDPADGDRVFVMQFESQAPVAIRMPEWKVRESQIELARIEANYLQQNRSGWSA